MDNIPIVKSVWRKDFMSRFIYRWCQRMCTRWMEILEQARALRILIFLTFGTGMGGGIIITADYTLAPTISQAEVGHIRLADERPRAYGKNGSFEGFCSGTGIAFIAKRIVKEKFALNQPVSFCKNIRNADRITPRCCWSCILRW